MTICQLFRRLLLLVALNSVCESYVIIKPGIWKYKNHPIAYETAAVVQDKSNPTKVAGRDKKNNAAPLLLLNGFGVGSFHQHRLIQELLKNPDHHDRTIYCIDYLGQGNSWPEDCKDGTSESERGLSYCGATWADQVAEFMEHVIRPLHHVGAKIHIVGNSVGGHLAVCVAAMRKDLVESVVLLNPTPVWGLNLPGWSGHLPAPWLPKFIGRFLFDRIRDYGTIQSFLGQVYSNPSAFDETLMQQIRACTEGNGGHAAFASIMWSPPISVPIQQKNKDGELVVVEENANFDQCLRALACDVLLLYGADDPWCKPAFAKRKMKVLAERVLPFDCHYRYVELSSVGHCPNHEAPTAVARILSRWLTPTSTTGSSANRAPNALHLADQEVIQESWGETIASERSEDEILLTLIDRLATTFV